MSFNVGGIPVKGLVIQNIDFGKKAAEEAVTQMIQEAKNDPAANIRKMQQPSGLSTFLDVKV